MTLDDVLHDLIKLIEIDKSRTVSWEQVSRWPKGALDIFLKEEWVKPTHSVKSITCPGCEENCFMSVHPSPMIQNQPVKFYIACDRRDDMGRIPILSEELQQWQITEMPVARWFNKKLGLKEKPLQDKNSGRIKLGNIQGKKNIGLLELDCQKQVSLKVSEHSLPLIEVVYFKENEIKIDKSAVISMVDLPPSINRYKPTIARREANKLDTEGRHKEWQKVYRNLKRKHPGKSDNWCSLQISKMDIADGRNSETIRKNMKK
jgi:hypothetical protein